MNCPYCDNCLTTTPTVGRLACPVCLAVVLQGRRPLPLRQKMADIDGLRNDVMLYIEARRNLEASLSDQGFDSATDALLQETLRDISRIEKIIEKALRAWWAQGCRP